MKSVQSWVERRVQNRKPVQNGVGETRRVQNWKPLQKWGG